MISKWLQRLRGGSGSSSTSEPSEPVVAPEPPSMPSEPPAESGMGQDMPESSGDEPA